MPSSTDALRERLADIDALECAGAILEWDQQVNMPKGGGSARAQHLGILTRMAHESLVDDSTAKLLESADPQNEEDRALVRVARRMYDLATKLPAALVAEKVRLSSEAHEVWVEAREENDFKKFQPALQRMVEICQQEAEAIGYEHDLYDALLDQYEEGAKTSEIRVMFDTIKHPLSDLVRRIGEQQEVDDSFLHGEWDAARQSEFTEDLVKKIGFDMSRGRQDTAPHPFCTSWAHGDVRITTRFLEYLPSAIFGSLHEAGHGMYEQGSPKRFDGTPLRGGASLGVHESQSRLWENIVGRSLPFWEGVYPALQEQFPALKSHPLDEYYKAVNKVRPSLIRVEADEVTYNLHVLIRFELEVDLLSGKLAVADAPEAWNAKYREILGIDPPNDKDGVLQDVHWSAGIFGYFPTYSMGNLLSYQIWNTLIADIPNTDELMRKGEFEPIFEWLRERVYAPGQMYPPKELVERVTGRPLAADDYLEGITAKYEGIYGL